MLGTFTKNTLLTSTVRVLNMIIGVIISIIIIRSLGPEGNGIYSLVILLPAFLLTFSDFGISYAIVYYISKKKYSPSEIFGINIIYSISVSIFLIVCGLIIVYFFNEKIFPNVERIYLLLSLSAIPIQIFFTLSISVLLGLQKITKYNIILFSQSCIFLLLVATFLFGLKLGIKAALIANIFSTLVANIILFIQIIKQIKKVVFTLTKNIFKDIFLYGIKIYGKNILNFFQYKFNMILLNIFLNPITVGLYSTAAVISEKILFITQSVSTIIFPRIVSETNKAALKKFTPLVCRNILFITFLIYVFLFLISRRLIILLYSKQFLDSIVPFQILLIGCIALSGSEIIFSDFIGRGKPMLGTYIYAVSAVFNIILNILFIPKFGIIGASFAFTISYILNFLITVIIYHRISGNKINDIIFIKKSDLIYYKNLLSAFSNFLSSKVN